MFGIGTGELLLIFIVALIVLGPQKLPEIASKLGRAYGTFRRLSNQFQRTLNSEIADLEEKEKEEKPSSLILYEEKNTNKEELSSVIEEKTVPILEKKDSILSNNNLMNKERNENIKNN